jgi:hypothetical protein
MQKIKATYRYLKEYLERLVEQGKLEFLKTFKLAPREEAAAKEVLVYASGQEKFPHLPGLGRYLAGKGFSSYYSSTLKTRRVIANLKKGGRTWFLSTPVLNSLDELYHLEAKEQPKTPPVAEAGMSKTPVGRARRPTGKVKVIWENINRERVGNEFLLTSEFVHQLAGKIKCKPEYVWHTLQVLERYGLCTRKRLPGQGILINFSPSPKPEASKAPSGIGREQEKKEMTLPELVDCLEKEIAEINEKISALDKLRAEKQNLLASIETYLSR